MFKLTIKLNANEIMNLVDRVEHWGELKHSILVGIVRISLGVFLMLKGISFASDTNRLAELVRGLKIDLWSVMGVHYVAFTHIVGGLLIAFGLLTRLSSILQIPILLGAVFFVNIRNGFSYLNSELWLSILALMLVIVFSVISPGRFSADEYMKLRRT